MIRVNIEGMMQPITKLRCSTILVSVFVLYPGHNFGHGDSDRIVGQRKQRTQHAGFTGRNRWKNWHLACESIAKCTLHFTQHFNLLHVVYVCIRKGAMASSSSFRRQHDCLGTTLLFIFKIHWVISFPSFLAGPEIQPETYWLDGKSTDESLKLTHLYHPIGKYLKCRSHRQK